jgi:hypothetical protein
MPKRKAKIGTIIIQGKEELTPNKTNLLEETKTQGTKILKGAIINAKGKIKKIFEPTSLVPFVVSLVTILTISPKYLTLNG